VSTRAYEYDRIDRYAFGFVVLAVTIVLSDFPQLAQHPERYIDVPRPADALLTLQAVGYVLQMALGLWLSFALLFDVARWRRLAVWLWPVALVLYFAPLPGAMVDPALAPAMAAAVFLLALFSRRLDVLTNAKSASQS
jgi:hypothetical protein